MNLIMFCLYNGRTHNLTRLSLQVFEKPFQPFILGQKTFKACKNETKYLFYGEQEAEYGTSRGFHRAIKVMKLNFFNEWDPFELILGQLIKVKDLIKYFWPEKK